MSVRRKVLEEVVKEGQMKKKPGLKCYWCWNPLPAKNTKVMETTDGEWAKAHRACWRQWRKEMALSWKSSLQTLNLGGGVL